MHKAFVTLLIAGLLSSCGTQQTGSLEIDGQVASFCDLAKPIRLSRKDTDDTIKQVEEHNAIGIKYCSWR